MTVVRLPTASPRGRHVPAGGQGQGGPHSRAPGVPACRCLGQRGCPACLQEFEDRAAPSAGARPLPPALLKPQSTGFEEYDPAAFGQDVSPGSGYQPQPATAEAVPAGTADGGDPAVEQQRRALEQYQKLAMERRQV